MKVLLFIGGIALVLVITSLLAIGSDVMSNATEQAIESAIDQLGEDPSTSAKQTSINVCAGLNIGSCNNEQDSVATTTTTTLKATVAEQPNPWLVIVVMTVLVMAAVAAVLFLFGKEK